MNSGGFGLSRSESLKVRYGYGSGSHCARRYAPSFAYLQHWDFYNNSPDLGKTKKKEEEE